MRSPLDGIAFVMTASSSSAKGSRAHAADEPKNSRRFTDANLTGGHGSVHAGTTGMIVVTIVVTSLPD